MELVLVLVLMLVLGESRVGDGLGDGEWGDADYHGVVSCDG